MSLNHSILLSSFSKEELIFKIGDCPQYLGQYHKVPLGEEGCREIDLFQKFLNHYLKR